MPPNRGVDGGDDGGGGGLAEVVVYKKIGLWALGSKINIGKISTSGRLRGDDWSCPGSPITCSIIFN